MCDSFVLFVSDNSAQNIHNIELKKGPLNLFLR